MKIGITNKTIILPNDLITASIVVKHSKDLLKRKKITGQIWLMYSLSWAPHLDTFLKESTICKTPIQDNLDVSNHIMQIYERYETDIRFSDVLIKKLILKVQGMNLSRKNLKILNNFLISDLFVNHRVIQFGSISLFKFLKLIVLDKATFVMILDYNHVPVVTYSMSFFLFTQISDWRLVVFFDFELNMIEV